MRPCSGDGSAVVVVYDSVVVFRMAVLFPRYCRTNFVIDHTVNTRLYIFWIGLKQTISYGRIRSLSILMGFFSGPLDPYNARYFLGTDTSVWSSFTSETFLNILINRSYKSKCDKNYVEAFIVLYHNYWYIHHLYCLPLSREYTQIAKFMGPTWGPPGSCRPLMGPMSAPRTLLPGQCTGHATQ